MNSKIVKFDFELCVIVEGIKLKMLDNYNGDMIFNICY